jgi:hypothetical protein
MLENSSNDECFGHHRHNFNHDVSGAGLSRENIKAQRWRLSLLRPEDRVICTNMETISFGRSVAL